MSSTPGGITKSCTFCIAYFDFGMLMIFFVERTMFHGDTLRKTCGKADYVKS